MVTAPGYRAGRLAEYQVRDDLARAGWVVTRAAGSKGVCDLVAFGPGRVVVVNVKRGKWAGPFERAALFNLAQLSGVVPVLANKPLGQLVPVYRLLTGTKQREWEQWEP